MEQQTADATYEELTARCGHECLNQPDHDGPHFYGYRMGQYSYEGLLIQIERLRALLWDVAAAPVAGSSETHYAVALSSSLWHDVMDAAGYDEMGQ